MSNGGYQFGGVSSPQQQPRARPQFSQQPAESFLEDEPTKPAIASKGDMPFPEESHQSYSAEMFSNASAEPFEEDIVGVLSEPVRPEDCEIKPDGSVYLPEIKYRRALLKAFGAGGWALIPRSPHSFQNGVLSREYALYCTGRFISQARGHSSITGAFQSTASVSEAVRSNALMRCCKDLGIAAELWDGNFVAQWRAQFAIRRSDGRRTLWAKRSAADQQ